MGDEGRGFGLEVVIGGWGDVWGRRLGIGGSLGVEKKVEGWQWRFRVLILVFDEVWGLGSWLEDESDGVGKSGASSLLIFRLLLLFLHKYVSYILRGTSLFSPQLINVRNPIHAHCAPPSLTRPDALTN